MTQIMIVFVNRIFIIVIKVSVSKILSQKHFNFIFLLRESLNKNADKLKLLDLYGRMISLNHERVYKVLVQKCISGIDIYGC